MYYFWNYLWKLLLIGIYIVFYNFHFLPFLALVCLAAITNEAYIAYGTVHVWQKYTQCREVFVVSALPVFIEFCNITFMDFTKTTSPTFTLECFFYSYFEYKRTFFFPNFNVLLFSCHIENSCMVGHFPNVFANSSQFYVHLCMLTVKHIMLNVRTMVGDWYFTHIYSIVIKIYVILM